METGDLSQWTKVGGWGSYSTGVSTAQAHSGTRSALLWALHQVQSGKMTVDEACAAASAHGFDLHGPVTHHSARLGHHAKKA